MILGIQLLGVIFGLFMIYLSHIKLKRKEFNRGEFTFWLILWVILILLVLFPNSLNFIVKDILQMNRTLDFFMIIGLVFVIGLGFYSYSMVNKLQKRMEKLIRQMAIKK